MPVRAVVVDDSLIIREGVAAILRLEPTVELVALCADPDEALAAVEAERPDVVLTDIRMPPGQGDEGIALAHLLREREPELGVVLLSQHVSPELAASLMDGGSKGRGYLLKDRLHESQHLAEALCAVAVGECRIDPLVVEALMGSSGPPDSPLHSLTPREREIIGDIAEGLSNQAIADRRFLTRRAVEKHASAIFAKLGLAHAEDVSRRVKATLLYLAEPSL